MLEQLLACLARTAYLFGWMRCIPTYHVIEEYNLSRSDFARQQKHGTCYFISQLIPAIRLPSKRTREEKRNARVNNTQGSNLVKVFKSCQGSYRPACQALCWRNKCRLTWDWKNYWRHAGLPWDPIRDYKDYYVSVVILVPRPWP